MARFSWKAVAAGAVAFGVIGGGLLVAKTYGEKRRRTAPKRIALIGDSYAEGLGPELAKIWPSSEHRLPNEFKFEGHKSTNTWQWATHAAACGQCGDWLTAFKPDLVLVALGVNDPKPDLKNYQTIVRGLHGIGARVVWIKPPVSRMTPSLAEAINSLGIEEVPATNVSLAADPEHLHPTGDGYRTWANDVATAVAAM